MNHELEREVMYRMMLYLANEQEMMLKQILAEI